MVIGNGLIARRFESYYTNDNFLVFASGVSNSKTTNPAAYNREINLLRESVDKHADKIFIYFSTCSIYDPGEKRSAYVQHKLIVEDIIQTKVEQYHIFRVSNIAGISTNQNTLLNFFFYHIKNGINFDLWTNACRNIIDMDDAYLIIDNILQNQSFRNKIINIANHTSYPVKEIISRIEFFLGIKSNYIEIDKGNCFEIDLSHIKSVVRELKIEFNEEYLSSLLNKYFDPTLTNQS